MFRLIAKLLVALSVLLMPFGMVEASATAAQPRHMAMNHCPEQRSSDHGKATASECTMACSAALPAVDQSVEEPPLFVSSSPRPALARALHGILLEIATPPPRIA
jgi:hypothetical protein